MKSIIGLAVVLGIAIYFLKGFDRLAGRGPKQIKTGMNQAGFEVEKTTRVPCSKCAELILPAAKICQFCKSQV